MSFKATFDFDENEKNKLIYQMEKKEKLNRVFEFYIWCAFSLLFFVGIFFDILVNGYSAVRAIEKRYLEVLLSFFVFVFPLVFRLVYGYLPLESLRKARAEKIINSPTQKTKKEERYPEEVNKEEIKRVQVSLLSSNMSRSQLSQANSLELISSFLIVSRNLSQSLYGRSGLYLMVGVFIGFSGLAFFYTQTVNLSINSSLGIESLFYLAPKFGILFFIEIVAFFFLRQYRSAMDEFRYYESIKRNREESLIILRLLIENEIKIDHKDLANIGIFSSKIGILDKDEKSEIVESRKLEKNEIDLLEKVLDLVSKSKR